MKAAPGALILGHPAPSLAVEAHGVRAVRVEAGAVVVVQASAGMELERAIVALPAHEGGVLVLLFGVAVPLRAGHRQLELLTEAFLHLRLVLLFLLHLLILEVVCKPYPLLLVHGHCEQEGLIAFLLLL